MEPIERTESGGPRLAKATEMAEDWRSHGACLSEDPELFFPDKSRGPLATQIAVAKAVCAECPVATTCLRWALSTNQVDGVWGGTDERDRQRIQRQLVAQVA